MFRWLLCLLMLLLMPASVFAQTDVVARHRAKYPTPLGKENTVKLLKDIAFEVGGGLLKKPTGNNCQGYSCDYICFKDGRGYDVLVDSENKAHPTWNGPARIDVNMCELATAPAPDPTPDPNPEPVPTPEMLERLRSIDNNVAEIRRLLTAAAALLGIR